MSEQHAGGAEDRDPDRHEPGDLQEDYPKGQPGETDAADEES